MLPEAEALMGLLIKADARLGLDLAKAERVPLRHYLRSLFPSPMSRPNSSFAKLQKAVTTYFRAAGDPDAELWAAEIAQFPIIQQADHSFLLLDSETLLNNLLFALGAEAAGARRALTIQCSSVSCISRRRPLRGSPFLDRRRATYNVFPFSKSVYARSAFLSLPRPVEAVFQPLDGRGPSLASDPFLAPFAGARFASGVEAYRTMNAALWRDLSAGLDVELAVADDRLSSELIALHLEDESSPIHRLIFHPEARDTFLRLKRELLASPWNIGVNRPEPDHFWLLARGSPRLRCMSFEPGASEPRYETGSGWRSCPFPFVPEVAAAAVRRGELVPDIILISLARCLLPGVDAIGGPSQQDYVALYQRLLLGCDDAAGLLSARDRATAARPYPSRLGGAPLLEVDEELQSDLDRLTPGTKAADVLGPYLDLSVGETIGTLSCAQYLAGHAARAMELKRENPRH